MATLGNWFREGGLRSTFAQLGFFEAVVSIGYATALVLQTAGYC